MKNEKNTTKYFVYVRKSTEGEERQALSIESQKDNVKKVFPELDIVEVFEEKHSAFKPYNRPVFEDMIKRIRKREASGIIAWHPDRLGRNEIDASTITYLVRTGIIDDLKFGSYNFDNSPEGIMMLQLALSQSQYFSSKLGKDVKRGLEKKIQMGWRPGLAPEGYLNKIGELQGLKGIAVDKKRFAMLRKAFDLLLTEAYTAMEVLNILNDEWGYKTVRRRVVGGGKLSKSSWYRILTSPFYTGIVIFNGQESKGKHKPLITIDEYNRVQELLGLKGCKRKPKNKNFAFSGMFKCGFCGCGITAEHKTKYIKSAKEVRGYDYYHCTHKKKETGCRQGSVEEKEITKSVISELKKMEMHPLFLEWALDYLDSQKETEKKKDKEVENNKNKIIKELEIELSGLTRMRAKGLIDDEEFLKEKNNLKKQVEKLKKNLNEEKNEEDKIELIKEKFVFSAHALKRFVEGDKRVKKEVLADLGSNREILDKKAFIKAYNWLLPIQKHTIPHNEKLARLEPLGDCINKRKKEALASLRLSWHGWRESNPR